MTLRPLSLTRGILLPCLALATAACGDRAEDVTGTSGQLQITLSGGSVSLTAGGSASASLTVVRPSGFTGAVQVSAESAPAGVTASPLTIAQGQTTGTLVIEASSAATPTTATVTIRATGENVTAGTATLSLTVQPRPVAASFTLSLAGPVSITLGATVSVALTITRVNLSEPINLSATGGLAGLGIAFSPAAVTGTSSTIQLTAAASLLPGIYPVTIRGSAAGATDQTVTLSVTVSAVVGLGSFTLSLGAPSISLTQGVSASVTATINRTNLSAPVTLTVTGQPPGLNVTVNPETTTGNQATITIAPAAALAVGAYTLTLRGNAAGLAEQTATLAVSVSLPASIGLSLDNVTASLAQGVSLTRQLTITRTNYTGAVTLSYDAPAGLSVVFSPSSLSGTATTTSISLSAIATMLPGPYPVTMRAAGVGIAERTIALDVTVLALAPSSFTLGNVPGCLSLVGPGSFTSNLRINRMNFTGPVALTVTGQPSGMSVTLNPESTASDQVQMVIVLGGAVATGDYVLTVHGNATGMPEQTASFRVSAVTPGTLGTVQISLSPSALTVSAGSGGNATVTVVRPTGSYCSAIQLSAEGAPIDVTIAPLTIPIGQTVGTLSLQTAPTVPIGTTPLIIRATSSLSLSNVTVLPGVATLPLTVQLPVSSTSFRSER